MGSSRRGMRRALIALALAAGVVAVIGATGAGATGYPPRQVPLGVTYNTVHMVAFQETGTQPTTAAQIQALAQLDDIIILPPVQIKRIGPALKADNPNAMLLVYENGMYSGENDPTNLPESWYLHTAAGKRIVSNVGRGKLMNPRSTAPYTDANGTYNGWSDYIGQSCARQQTTYTAGCFLDLLGPAGIRPEYNVGGAVPVDPQTQALFTPLDYESMTGSVADAARAALPAGATVTGNGYVNGHAYYLKASSTLNNYTDAAEAQAWLNRPATQITASQWVRGVQMVIDNGAAGSGMLLEASCSCTNSTEVNASRTFDLATYLIANTGSAYFDFLAGSGGNLRAWQADSSLYHLNLGTPTKTYASAGQYLANGVYQRAYTGGMVLVNPGTVAVTVRLLRAYHTLAGASVTSVRVAAHSASILVS